MDIFWHVVLMAPAVAAFFLYFGAVLLLLAMLFAKKLPTEIPNPAQEAQHTHKE